MKELTKIEQSLSDELLAAFKEMPQAKSDYVLKEMVIGGHETIEMQYAHCVLNLRLAYNALRRAKISLEKSDYQTAQYKEKAKTDKLFEFKWQEKEIDKEECECAVIGKMREFSCLYKIWQSFPKKFTRADVNTAEPEYWKRRAIKQANQDIIAVGRVRQGNQDLLRQIGREMAPQLDHVKETEHRFIEGNSNSSKLMIAVPVKEDIPEEEQASFKVSCIVGLMIPTGIQHSEPYICHGRKVASAYDDIVREALRRGADYLLTVEDDTFPPPDALVKLLRHIADGKKVVGAWYPKRDGTGDGVPIVLDGNEKRVSLAHDGKTHEVYTLPMGCSLYSMEVFYRIEQPWFETTDCLTQDSFFSQKLRDAGFKLYCDTSIRCKHIDRVTSKVYE